MRSVRSSWVSPGHVPELAELAASILLVSRPGPIRVRRVGRQRRQRRLAAAALECDRCRHLPTVGCRQSGGSVKEGIQWTPVTPLPESLRVPPPPFYPRIASVPTASAGTEVPIVPAALMVTVEDPEECNGPAVRRAFGSCSMAAVLTTTRSTNQWRQRGPGADGARTMSSPTWPHRCRRLRRGSRPASAAT